MFASGRRRWSSCGDHGRPPKTAPAPGPAPKAPITPGGGESESTLQLADEPDEGGPEVPVRVDVELDEWRLVVPEFPPLPSPVAFIDGVQRIELRVVTDNDGAPVFGAFASLGVGAVLAAA